jgi:alpha/beta superfamily hydrolase
MFAIGSSIATFLLAHRANPVYLIKAAAITSQFDFSTFLNVSS